MLQIQVSTLVSIRNGIGYRELFNERVLRTLVARKLAYILSNDIVRVTKAGAEIADKHTRENHNCEIASGFCPHCGLDAGVR